MRASRLLFDGPTGACGYRSTPIVYTPYVIVIIKFTWKAKDDSKLYNVGKLGSHYNTSSSFTRAIFARDMMCWLAGKVQWRFMS
jgi:hypothetical protein